MVLDNGLHILIGAYRETVRLMRHVGGDPDRLLMRVPFTWNIHERFILDPGLPPPFNLLAGLLATRGVSSASASRPRDFCWQCATQGLPCHRT